MNMTNKHNTGTLTRTGMRLTLVVLVLLVSSCAQSGSPSVATQPSITPPVATVLAQPTAAGLHPQQRMMRHSDGAA